MINRNSTRYAVGKFISRAVLLDLGNVLGKKWVQGPIYKGYPNK